MKKLIFVILILSLLLSSALMAKVIGPFVESADAQRDTTTISALYPSIGSVSVVGMYLYCSSTTDLADPMNQVGQIQKHTITSGLVIIDTASSAAIGFSADLTDGDILWIMDSPPTGGLLRQGITATKVASGISRLDYTLFLQNAVDTASSKLEYAEDMLEEIQDSAQSASQVRMQSITFSAVTTTDADTTFFAEVTGGNVTIVRIEATVTTATATTGNMQLVGRYPLSGAAVAKTSMNADVDIDAEAIGTVFRWDLSNFGAVFSTTAIGVPIAAGDIGEESCEVPINVKLGFECGETLGVDAIFNVEIWYMTNGTGEIIAATAL